ncbi:MAG TPA: type IV toxin-antitoxin system AbiEi family antitoxin domain-containing protein [Solirubrobacterales bacterium]|nr:type IV toxin-antitoxin system AbiEi family antitoxin domain-containing protein [Solirubrobacterales bacterium]
MPAETVKTIPEGRFLRSRDDDRGLAEFARRQHGVVGRWQLIYRGWSEGAIDKRIRSGRLHRLHAGIYAVGHRVIPKQGHWMAAVLASGPGAVLSHQTAAALWDLRGYSGGAIHVTLPHKSTSSKRIKRHHAALPADEVAREQGIPVTSVHRTIFDLASIEDMDAIVAMIREAEYGNRYDRLSLPHLLERYPAKRGSRKVRAALERLKSEPPGRKRKGLEERFAPFLRRHRLPLPRFNDWIYLGDKRYCVDCHWPGTGQIVELDGWQGHSTRSAFRSDRERDRRLRVAGYSVIHLTWAQLDDEPEAIATDLRALLKTNGALRAGPHHPPASK